VVESGAGTLGRRLQLVAFFESGSLDGFTDAGESFYFLDNKVANIAIELLKKFSTDAIKRMSRAMGPSSFESKFTARFLVNVFHQRFLHAQ